MKIAINGFGRVGRAAFKVALEKNLEIVAINDLIDAKTLAYLLKYDSVYGRYDKSVEAEEDALIVDGKKYPLYAEKDPAKLPWNDLEVDLVVECTGFFTEREGAAKHIEAGAKKVLISAPTKSDDVPTVLMGINENQADGQDMIACASCTTNGIAPVMKVLDEKFGVAKSVMNTIHAYTATQGIVDGPNKKMRRGRAAAVNIIPTSTGAAKATARALPQLDGKFDGMAMRVPVKSGSVAYIVVLLNKDTTVEEVNVALQEQADGRLRGILAVTDEELVSSDIIGATESCIVDSLSTNVVDGNLVQIVAWYDNEWGYTNRLIEEAIMFGDK